MKPRYYLAYGMNADVDGMKSRCPTAVKVGRARVNHWQLVFRGVADVVQKRGARMWCALWTLQPRDEAALDSLEGYPHGYGKRLLRVTFEGQEIEAMIYVMPVGRRRSQMTPSSYYEQLLVDGYRDFGMPQRQITNAKRRAVAWLREENRHAATARV